MIRWLRCTFVMVSVCSVAAVLFVILGVVNWMNYRQVVGDVDRILDILAENNGSFPERGVPEEEPERDRRGAPLAYRRKLLMKADISQYISMRTKM